VHPEPEVVNAVTSGHRTMPGVLLASPNPFISQTALLLTLPKAQQVEVSVLDVSGRIVWRMPSTALEAGQHRVPWFGQDASGRRVGAGMCFVRVRGDAGVNLSRAVIRLQ